MQILDSYVCGAWKQGNGQGAELTNPTTNEVIARTSTEGFDMAAVVRHGREVGGKALRVMTFAQRAAMLKAVSAAIHAERDALLDLAAANGGNTRGDGKFDVDGATGTLAAYAGFGKALGERPFLVDGDGAQLGRTARFWGQHVRVPRRGVAVHVNAYNFPAWGMMEKAACAWLAGVPVIEKPAAATALVAWRIAQIVVASGLVPEGAFQFLCGSTGDLFDHLRGQDCVAFTGSAATGAVIRANPTLVRHNVRVNIEADSLNSAILAPDVDASSETYGLFLSNVTLDMTQKAGQKCTAVRRILVPRERVADVQKDLIAELARVPLGDPADNGVRLGPVAHARQQKDVVAGIQKLAAVAEIVCGGVTAPRAGCFVSPTLLVAKDASPAVLHELEVFGPVATILPYDGDADTAAEIAARGEGSLVCSVYSNDADWTERAVLGLAPYHGRIWLGSDKMAEQALPPGMVLPGMVHGGPGRAGGGEELGGLRGLEFYTQRVALQGFKGLVEAKFGAETTTV
jgi:3,4-dehydroadipyl-CoA semialdehyde dehydrogenase